MSSQTLIGIAAALASSALYSLAVGLQAFEARQVDPRHTLRLSLIDRLARRPLWVLGAATGVLGWALQALALSLAPLTLVEPTLAATLGFLLLIGSRALREQVGSREVAGVAALITGIVALGFVAPAHSPTHSGGLGLVVTFALLGLVVVAPHAIRDRPRAGALVATSAGVAYAGVALATKFAADDAAARAWVALLAWLALVGVVSLLGVVSEMSALQSSPVTQVAPIVFGLNVLVPVVLAPVLAGESWSDSARASSVLILSLAAVVSGVVVLSRSTSVDAVLATAAET